MHPPTYSPSFQKSPTKMGLVARSSRTRLLSSFRCSGVLMSSTFGSRPIGMYWKSHAKSAPFSE